MSNENILNTFNASVNSGSNENKRSLNVSIIDDDALNNNNQISSSSSNDYSPLSHSFAALQSSTSSSIASESQHTKNIYRLQRLNLNLNFPKVKAK